MKKITILILAFSTFTRVFGQNVQVVNHFTGTEKHTVKIFDLIDNAFNLAGKQKVATLKGFSLNTGKQTIANLFSSLWDNANCLVLK